MKKHLILKLLLVTMITSFIYSCGAPKEAAVNNREDYSQSIEKQQFIFTARQALPMEDARYNPRLMFPQSGSNLYQLDGRYDVKVTPDSVIAFLPFFGRSFVAPMDPTKGGIQFTSTDFGYTRNVRKKNYEITIIPKDVRDIQKLYFTISPTGYAYLQVQSTNRTPISFNGIIENAEKK